MLMVLTNYTTEDDRLQPITRSLFFNIDQPLIFVLRFRHFRRHLAIRGNVPISFRRTITLYIENNIKDNV